MSDYEVHPAADLFPLLPKDQLKELAADIKKHGLIHPIILHEKKILDGRNRLAACEMANVVPYFRNYQGEHSPTEYVIAVNLKRRQLTPSQRAAVAVRSLPLLKAEAKERQKMAAGNHSLTEKIPQAAKGEAREKAAELAEVNPRYVSDAERIQEKSPEVFEQMASGEKTISEAKKELGMTRREAFPEPGYMVYRLPIDPVSRLKSVWHNCSKEEKSEFLKWAKQQN